MATKPILLATRGSALALAQAELVLGQCRAAFPELGFEMKIIKTTGDKLQTASLSQEGQSLPKGLFTKELEAALLEQQADMAVHSLKDLPTELPAGLRLGAVGQREDVRDVLVYRGTRSGSARGFAPGITIRDLPAGVVVATSSTRRKAQLLMHNSSLKVPEIRGNVGTRLMKIAENAELDATILAMAGLARLGLEVTPAGELQGANIPSGLLASLLPTEEMLPCVGQGALGVEIRAEDKRLALICRRLNHVETERCVTAERAFLARMGGGCQSPVAALAEPRGTELWMRAISFADGPVRKAQGTGSLKDAAQLGRQLADELRPKRQS